MVVPLVVVPVVSLVAPPPERARVDLAFGTGDAASVAAEAERERISA